MTVADREAGSRHVADRWPLLLGEDRPAGAASGPSGPSLRPEPPRGRGLSCGVRRRSPARFRAASVLSGKLRTDGGFRHELDRDMGSYRPIDGEFWHEVTEHVGMIAAA